MAALEERAEEAAETYRGAIEAWRALDCTLDLALCELDLVSLLGPDHPDATAAKEASGHLHPPRGEALPRAAEPGRRASAGKLIAEGNGRLPALMGLAQKADVSRCAVELGDLVFRRSSETSSKDSMSVSASAELRMPPSFAARSLSGVDAQMTPASMAGHLARLTIARAPPSLRSSPPRCASRNSTISGTAFGQRAVRDLGPVLFRHRPRAYGECELHS